MAEDTSSGMAAPLSAEEVARIATEALGTGEGSQGAAQAHTYTDPATGTSYYWDQTTQAWVAYGGQQTYKDSNGNTYTWDATAQQWVLQEGEEEEEGSGAQADRQVLAGWTRSGTGYVDGEGIQYEWDADRKGWFPKVDEDFLAMYQLNYGSHKPDLAPPKPPATHPTDQHTHAAPASTQPAGDKAPETPASATSASTVTEVAGGAHRKRKMQVRSEWFNMPDEANPNVYIQGLPPNVTVADLKTFMGRCGIIKEENGQAKIKIYRNADGSPKGDALCTYLKIESVALALDLLDGAEMQPGHVVHLQRAKFQQKGEQYRPTKKPKKKQKSQQEKLLGWSDKVAGGAVSKKVAAIVILKNMFDPKEFEEDPVGITEIKDDVMTECGQCGQVKKVIVFDRHKEGVVSVRFDNMESAEKAIKLMNGRWFGGRQIKADHWDGKTNYEVEETDHEREQRLTKWESFIGADTEQQPPPDPPQQ
eukprot:comp23685_c1_seq1/m.40643 comp23685_c1_seq1/g.40643  ORF comp23685_c1_seq1/g.40643 comp23685_c1_seq1/m.40643 type:complete len:477 (-) comp23685_c1_seq1:261-1691(-)